MNYEDFMEKVCKDNPGITGVQTANKYRKPQERVLRLFCKTRNSKSLVSYEFKIVL